MSQTVQLWGKVLLSDQLDFLYFTYKFFKIDGNRPPLEEEVLGIFTVLEKKDKIPQPHSARALFTMFADPEHRKTRAIHKRVERKVNELNIAVNDAFDEWIRQDPDALYRAITLRRVPQRIELPKVSLRDKSWRYNDYVKPHQVISLSIIATSCENENGTPMTPSNRYEVVKICLFGNVEGTEKLVTRYATPSEQVAQEMEAWMAQFQFSNLFLENTQAILNIHKQALEAAGLRVRIRPVPQRDPVTTVAAATTAIESLTLSALANPKPSQDIRQTSDNPDEVLARANAELRAGGLPPAQALRPNLANPYNGRPPPSFSENQPTGSWQESRAAREQNDRPTGRQEPAKRKEQSQPSYQTEPSKRRETGATRPSNPPGRSSPPPAQQQKDRPEPQIKTHPSGRLDIDSQRETPPPPPKVLDSGAISYPAHRPEQSRRRGQQRRDRSPPPPPGSGSSDHGDKDKQHEQR